jgi:hypothetical protein
MAEQIRDGGVDRSEGARSIERLSELRVLEPDAEADACGPAFEQYVRERMDEWHAAIDAFDHQGTDALSREVIIVRDPSALRARAEGTPPGPRTEALASAIVAQTEFTAADAGATELVTALRARLEPRFLQSKSWQNAVECLSPYVPTPWVVQACRELVRDARGDHGAPSPLAPWLALWARGAWPYPLGDGGLIVWVPRLDLGPDGVTAALATVVTTALAKTPLMRAGFTLPHAIFGPGYGGVEFFGVEQTDGLDLAPPKVLRFRSPMMPINPMMPPTPNLPTPPRPTASPMPNVPTPTPNLPTPTVSTNPAVDSKRAPDEPASEGTVLDRLRRWFKK